MSTGKFVAGFIVGGVVGAVIGVLLAPQSGEETREMISASTKEAYGKVSDAAKEIQQKAVVVMYRYHFLASGCDYIGRRVLEVSPPIIFPE